MAWWDVITKPIEDHVIKPIVDTGEQAAREAERLAREAAEATQRAAEEAARIAAEQAAEAQRIAEAAARETQRLAEEAARKAEEAAAAAAKLATDTYNYAKHLENDVEARTISIAATVASTTTELANAGLDVTLDEFMKLSAEVEKQVIAGIDIVDDYAWAAYAWLDENACRIGLTSAISMGCVAAFTPAQPAGAATSTTLSFMATPILYTADMAAKMAVSTAMGEIVGTGFLAIPGVGGSVDSQLLKNVISNCIYYSLDSAALWATPAGVGIAIGAAVAPVVATLVCTRTCPNGFSKALAA
jgi:hypothetical protein